MIIDCHTHLAGRHAIPEEFYDGWVENLRVAFPPDLPERARGRIEERFRAGHSDLDATQHVAEMDAAGIAVSVSLIIDFGFAFDQFPSIESVFEEHRELARRFPGRFRIFAGIDPRRGDYGIELFERSVVEWGFAGLKLYPPCGFSPSDERLFPYYEICAQHRIPVLTHIGPTTPRLSFEYTEPSAVDGAAFRFPKVNFILGHGAVVHRDAAALLAEYRPNVFLDISGFQVDHRRGRFCDTLAFHKERGLLRKLLFGTDWPIHRHYGSQKTWTQVFSESAAKVLTPAEATWICESNAREILRLGDV